MADVINCGVYDYFEAACVRRDKLIITLHNGEVVRGTAHDLMSQKGEEFLMLLSDGSTEQVNLKQIDTLEFSNRKEKIRVY